MAHVDPERPVDEGPLSPAPGTPQSATKAYVGAAAAALVAFLTALLPYLADGATVGQVSTEGWVIAVIAGIVGGGLTGGGVYAVRNHVKIT